MCYLFMFQQEEEHMGRFIVKVLEVVDHFLATVANYFYDEDE